MSGIPCIVVASGNRTQAHALSFIDATPDGVLPEARLSAALAQTLCTLAGTYDAVATPEQQTAATNVMASFNTEADKLDVSRRVDPRSVCAFQALCKRFNTEAQAIIDSILANP